MRDLKKIDECYDVFLDSNTGEEVYNIMHSAIHTAYMAGFVDGALQNENPNRISDLKQTAQ